MGARRRGEGTEKVYVLEKVSGFRRDGLRCWLDLSTVTKVCAASGRRGILLLLARETSAVDGRGGGARGSIWWDETVISRELGYALGLGATGESPQIQGDHRWGI